MPRWRGSRKSGSIAAFVGPRLAATVKELYHGDYTHAFLIAAALRVLGMALTLILIATSAPRMARRIV
jgi:hypothetical protein